MKDRTIIEFFFRGWCLYWEAEFSICQLLITYLRNDYFFYSIDPAVSNAIRKLFFLSPSNTFCEVGFKGFTNDPFFHALPVDHFILWVNAHGHIHKLLI